MATEYAKEQYAGVYKSFCDFSSRYYGIDNLLAGSAFKSLFPIHAFDVSKQSERLKNVNYTGGVLGMLASLAARDIPLAARALPTILSGLTTGLFSGGINKAISGDGLYLHKHDKCYRVQKCKGNGLNLAPHPRFVEGNGPFLKHGNDISDSDGLLMGKNSPFKNIPVLGWLL